MAGRRHKGDKQEREIVALLRSLGVECDSGPHSGAAGGLLPAAHIEPRVAPNVILQEIDLC